VLAPGEIKYVDDRALEDGAVADDGAAYCSAAVMRRIVAAATAGGAALRPPGQPVSAVQARLAAFKGMLVVRPGVSGVEIPRGNVKFAGADDGSPDWSTVHVCHFAALSEGPQSVSAANLRNLAARGVPAALLAARQAAAVAAKAELVTGPAGGDDEPTKAERGLAEAYRRAAFRGDAGGGRRALGDRERLGALVAAGFRRDEPLRQHLALRVMRAELEAACARSTGGGARAAFRLFLDDAVRARLVPDRDGVLRDGECYVASSDGAGGVVAREGHVLAMRDPSYFAADVRVLRCVGAVPALAHHVGVLVLPAAHPAVTVCEADRMSGGDYDGDEALVVYDAEIVAAVRDRDAAVADAAVAAAAPAADGAPASCADVAALPDAATKGTARVGQADLAWTATLATTAYAMAKVTVNRAAYAQGLAADAWGVDDPRTRRRAAHAFIMVDRPLEPPKPPDRLEVPAPHWLYRVARDPVSPVAPDWTFDESKAARSTSVVGVLFDALRAEVAAAEARVRGAMPPPRLDEGLFSRPEPADAAHAAAAQRAWSDGFARAYDDRRAATAALGRGPRRGAAELDAAREDIDEAFRAAADALRDDARSHLGLDLEGQKAGSLEKAFARARAAYSAPGWFSVDAEDRGALKSQFVATVAFDFLLSYKQTLQRHARDGFAASYQFA